MQRVQLALEVGDSVCNLVEVFCVFHGLKRVQVLFYLVEHFILLVDERRFFVNSELELNLLPTLLNVVDVGDQGADVLYLAR